MKKLLRWFGGLCGEGRQHARLGRTRLPLAVERLETRDMLSATAVTNVIPLRGGEIQPLTNGAFEPAKIREAYGFNRIGFNGVLGDGRGATIAIVDAFDDPTVSNDLYAFDRYFG